jgi:hypothetical protein
LQNAAVVDTLREMNDGIIRFVVTTVSDMFDILTKF